MRAGARLRFLQNFTLASNFELDPRSGASNVEYIDTLTLAYTHAEKVQLVVGQQKPGFTYEYDISSNRILTFERSLLVNQFAPSKAPGAMMEGLMDKFHWRLGLYSGQPLDEDLADPFGLVAVEYDFSEISNHEQMTVQLFYLYNSEKESNGAKPYEHAYALSFDFENESRSFLGQVMLGDGYSGRPDAWGFTMMPAKFILGEELQLVARYRFASAAGADGLQLQNRYERQVPELANKGLGDRYHAGYLGLNWYIHDNRLKIMTGIEYSEMSGGDHGEKFSGWTGFGGVRFYF